MIAPQRWVRALIRSAGKEGPDQQKALADFHQHQELRNLVAGTDACASAVGSHLRSSEGVWNGVSTRYTNGAIASEDWPCGNMSPESRAGRLSDSQIRPDTGLLQEHVSCARSASEPGNGVPLRVTGGPVRELHAPQVQRHPAFVARASAAIRFPDPRRPERCLGEGSSWRYRGRSDGHRGM